MKKHLLLAILAGASIASPVCAATQDDPAPTAAEPTPSQGHYSTSESKIGDLKADPAAKSVIDRYLPGLLDNEYINRAADRTLKDIAGYINLDDTKRAAIDADLAKIPTTTK